MEDLLVDIGLFEDVSHLEELLKGKKLHIVCMISQDPLSNFSRLIEKFAPNNLKAQLDTTVAMINTSNQAASLYPVEYLSFLPQKNYHDMANSHDHERIFNELIFNANEELIKKDRMVLLLDKEHLDYNRAAELIKLVVMNNGCALKWLRRITLI
ncbi:MAG: hypothetical protein RLZZ172_216 [Bacteroidota bacterium]|jgi:hypothetical protein